MSTETAAPKCHITIHYCTGCNWLLRAGWMAQELLSTFGTALGGVTMVSGDGGIFRIQAGSSTIWDRKTDGGFPDIVTLKQKVRDHCFPERDLGHLDRPRT